MDDHNIPDVQLKELIDAINRDGVEKARREEEEILRRAREEGERILSEARAEADALLARARQEQERLERSGRESLQQAARDLLLKVRQQLEALFAAVLKEKARAALHDQEIAAAIAAMISGWSPERRGEVEIVLPPERFATMAKALRQALAARLVAGVEVKAAPDVADGFRVAEKDGQAYYDFSAASVAENLAVFLKPVMAGIVADALKQGS